MEIPTAKASDTAPVETGGIGALLTSPHFRERIVACVNAWAFSGGGSASRVTDRLRRRIHASDAALQKYTSVVVRAAVNDPQMIADYGALRRVNVSHLGALTDRVLSALAADETPDFRAIGDVHTSEHTIATLKGFAPIAANVVLDDAKTPAHVAAFVRDKFSTAETVDASVRAHIAHIITTAALLPYNGDLQGVEQNDLQRGFETFFTNWAPAAAQ